MDILENVADHINHWQQINEIDQFNKAKFQFDFCEI